MIKLRLSGQFEFESAPFVTKIVEQVTSDSDSLLKEIRGTTVFAEHPLGSFSFDLESIDEVYNDILICSPSNNKVQRLIRANSRFNTLLITERCDQLCLMCSQPPRNTDDAWRFPLYKQAIKMAAPNSRIILSGGEPTLYKNDLFNLLLDVGKDRSDISFHILTNGQHINDNDISTLLEINELIEVLWAIPLYSHDREMHEKIVDKKDSFDALIENFFKFGKAKSNIELRTVVTQLNFFDLPHLAKFIAFNLGFINHWSIMAMENIGFAKANINNLFVDYSSFFNPIGKAIDIATAANLAVRLFNFPLCSVPENYRKLCNKSISDWKNKYLDVCDACDEVQNCCGFFEWYDDKVRLEAVGPIKTELNS